MMLAEDTRLLSHRQRTLLLTATAVARVSAFALVPQVPVLMGQCEQVQVTQAQVISCLTEGEP